MTNSETQSSGDVQTQGRPKVFGRAYWMLNSIEAFERLAYFGVRAVIPIYIMQATEPGGLHLTAMDKGWIYGWWAFFQSFLPMFTGGFADRYGYKKVLAIAIGLNAMGYLMMAFLTNYWGFFGGVLVLATGTAFFKPSLQGSLAQNLTRENSSLGWGIFYWVVNVGAFGAPFLATLILGRPHSAEGWRNLFLASSAFTCVNLLLLFTFKDVPSGASKSETAVKVFVQTIRNLGNIRLVVWLLIMSCFWLMMYQLWDLHPNFIEDWVDSGAIAAHMPVTGWTEYGDTGLLRVPQQILLNLNAGLIILLMLPISWVVRKMRTLTAMLVGMTVATAGVLISGMTGNGWFLLLGIVFFSLGEMLTGPKKNEYLGLIAPKGKKGLYLGYVNIPVGIGVFAGSLIAGYVYDNFGEKASLSIKYIQENPQVAPRAMQSADWSDNLEKAAALMGVGRKEAVPQAAKFLGVDPSEVQKILTEHFRYDRGHLQNLALQYLACHATFNAQVAATIGQPVNKANAAAHVGVLSNVLGIARFEALERAHHLMNQAKPIEISKVGTQLIRELGGSSDNTINMAIEYLAQSTPRLATAVAKLSLGKTTDIAKALGIGRTKSFDALSSALSSPLEQLTPQLSKEVTGLRDLKYQSYVYLMGLKHIQFDSLNRHDWSADRLLLKSILFKDTEIVKKIKQTRGKAGLNIEQIIADKDYLFELLGQVNWANHPKAILPLLGLNPQEAQVKAVQELSKAKARTTQLLWDKYQPNLRVWVPFAIIGVFAAIALAIFGKKAKRWKDMDA